MERSGGSVSGVGPLVFAVLIAGQIAGCNEINSTPEKRASAGFYDYVCSGAWPVCMAYDAAARYMSERLKRN